MSEPREGWYVAYLPDGRWRPALRSGDGWFIPLINRAFEERAALPPDWTLGPRLDDLMRDAARYRWLVSDHRTYKQGERIARWFDDRDFCPSADEISALIDAEIEREAK